MEKFTGAELISMKEEDLNKKVNGYKKGKFTPEEGETIEDNTMIGFYKKILLYLDGKNVDLTKILVDMGAENPSSYDIEEILEGKFINKNISNAIKFKNIKILFQKLCESEEFEGRMENYKFELYKNDEKTYGTNSKDSKENIGMGEKIINNIISVNKQVIFTGAPGTGKTWLVKSYVEKQKKEKEADYKFVQFHSSYDYTDFVEGLRPVPDKNGGNMFVRMAGVFKSFCRHIVEENLKMINEKLSKSMTIENYFEYMKDQNNRNNVYEILNNMPYYFIIDEINRADLSRVFGELMYGLEESYREIHNRFDTQYKNLPTYKVEGDNVDIIAEDCFKDGFFVPYNLHIIGTMNDIDRSVESFDFALRRRFIWIEIKANDIMYESLKSMKAVEGKDNTLENISNKICRMNNKITETGYGLSEAHHIGPAYFKDLVNASNKNAKVVLKDIFKNRIEPILREYMRGRKAEAQDNLIRDCRDELLG